MIAAIFTSEWSESVRWNPDAIGGILTSIRNVSQVKLNARQVETAKPKDKNYKMADGGGCISRFRPGALNTGAWNTDALRQERGSPRIWCLAYCDACSGKGQVWRS